MPRRLDPRRGTPMPPADPGPDIPGRGEPPEPPEPPERPDAPDRVEAARPPDPTATDIERADERKGGSLQSPPHPDPAEAVPGFLEPRDRDAGPWLP